MEGLLHSFTAQLQKAMQLPWNKIYSKELSMQINAAQILR